MFFRIKKSGARACVQVVENKRVDGAVRQSVIANLGRADDLIASDALASLLASGAKLTDQVLLVNALEEDADGSSARPRSPATRAHPPSRQRLAGAHRRLQTDRRSVP
jgi:hypothetical protein